MTWVLKLNEINGVFRPPLCTYRLNWDRITSWACWDEWDDTAIQTEDSKFEPWRFEAKQATSWSCRLPTILNLYEWAGKKHFIWTRDRRRSKQAASTTVYECSNINICKMLGLKFSHLYRGTQLQVCFFHLAPWGWRGTCRCKTRIEIFMALLG